MKLFFVFYTTFLFIIKKLFLFFFYENMIDKIFYFFLYPLLLCEFDKNKSTKKRFDFIFYIIDENFFQFRKHFFSINFNLKKKKNPVVFVTKTTQTTFLETFL